MHPTNCQLEILYVPIITPVQNDEYNAIVTASTGDLDAHEAEVSFSKTRIVVSLNAVDNEIPPLSFENYLAASTNSMAATAEAMNEAGTDGYYGRPTGKIEATSSWATPITSFTAEDREALFHTTKHNRGMSKSATSITGSRDDVNSDKTGIMMEQNLLLANPSTTISSATDPSFATASKRFDIPKKNRWGSKLTTHIKSLSRMPKEARERQRRFIETLISRRAARSSQDDGESEKRRQMRKGAR